MTTEQTALQRLKEVCEAATLGPWTADIRTGVYSVYPAGQKHNCLADVADEIAREAGRGEESQPGGYRYLTDEQQSNAAFIAAARTALPALIELCEALEKQAQTHHIMDELGIRYNADGFYEAQQDHKDATAAVEAARAKLESIFTAHQPRSKE